ncbi:hypothetical protein LGQ02_09870 [Bacillus shivajii]|nr:hypothetical protein [Bacillus shivajii]UCZ55001.1 hypothetical protein LGQ02_09870 [Bacillus shivajii]
MRYSETTETVMVVETTNNELTPSKSLWKKSHPQEEITEMATETDEIDDL